MKVDWFSRGREAFTEGRPCFIRDARISSRERAAWYAGWKHQAALNNFPNLSEADRTDLAQSIGQILESIRSLP